MKTIRTNTFETNSSSTHSLTISQKGSKKSSDPLVDDGILYPDRLKYYQSSFGDCDILCCDTKDTKAALLAQWIFTEYENGYFDEDVNKKEWLNDMMDLLVSKLGYKSINIPWKTFNSSSNYISTDYSPHTEYDSVELDFNNLEEVYKFIDDTVLNDDMEIVDVVTPQ